MGVDRRDVSELLRAARSGALGSWSVSLPGYPFVSLVTFVPDARLRPHFLLSGLAEHTRNLRSDPRASLLVAEAGDRPLESARISLVGQVRELELDDASRRRFLRYSPESADYLALGDFRFFRMDVERLRFIGGFARMGWGDLPSREDALTAGEEGAVVDALGCYAPVGVSILGVDYDGLDLRVAGVIRRLTFADGPTDPSALLAAARAVLGTLEPAGGDAGLA